MPSDSSQRASQGRSTTGARNPLRIDSSTAAPPTTSLPQSQARATSTRNKPIPAPLTLANSSEIMPPPLVFPTSASTINSRESSAAPDGAGAVPTLPPKRKRGAPKKDDDGPRDVQNWSTERSSKDGRSAMDHVVDYLKEPGNWAEFRASKAKPVMERISTYLVQNGCKAREGNSIKSKINNMASNWNGTYTKWFKASGGGMPEEGTDERESIIKECYYFFDLFDVMVERSSGTPKATWNTLDPLATTTPPLPSSSSSNTPGPYNPPAGSSTGGMMGNQGMMSDEEAARLLQEMMDEDEDDQKGRGKGGKGKKSSGSGASTPRSAKSYTRPGYSTEDSEDEIKPTPSKKQKTAVDQMAGAMAGIAGAAQESMKWKAQSAQGKDERAERKMKLMEESERLKGDMAKAELMKTYLSMPGMSIEQAYLLAHGHAMPTIQPVYTSGSPPTLPSYQLAHNQSSSSQQGSRAPSPHRGNPFGPDEISYPSQRPGMLQSGGDKGDEEWQVYPGMFEQD